MKRRITGASHMSRITQHAMAAKRIYIVTVRAIPIDDGVRTPFRVAARSWALSPSKW
jgi:hypothetical protein